MGMYRMLFLHKIYKIMCLGSKNGYKTLRLAITATKNPIIAIKDIVVYKRLLRNNFSPYKDFKYEKGYHYYQTGDKEFTFSTEKYTYSETYYKFTVHVGLHCYKRKKTAMYSKASNEIVVKMIIPKGAKYYEGEGDTLVTNNLIYI